MKTSIKSLLGLALSALILTACSTEQTPKKQLPDLTQYVNPNIGSVHSRWFFYTPAALPFGMAKLSPQTNAQGSMGSWNPNGYDDRHESIEGFGHFHEFQIGGLISMPTVGALQTVNGTLEDPDSGYRSRFDKADEHAEPGYYSVMLKDYGIKAELTATERVGFHRYTFPQSDLSHIIFDLGHKQGESGEVIRAQAEWDGAQSISGSIETYPTYLSFCDPENSVKMYFSIQLNIKPTAVGNFVNGEQQAGAHSTDGKENGLYISFPTSANQVVEMQVGLSYTSIENAQRNLETEAGQLSFYEAKVAAHEAWNEKLNRILVEGGQPEERVKFYTGLYHALLGRGLASDANGQYPKYDGSIGQIPLDEHGVPQYKHYNTDGIWGGFWNLTQVWSLAYPDYLSQYVQSNIDYYKERGFLHDGTAAGTYTNGVQTNFQGLVLAAAYNAGIRDFDVNIGYEAALKTETDYAGRNFGNGKYDLKRFVELGYVPYEDTVLANGWVFNFGASHTLEYAFSSHAVGQMAEQLGHSEDAALLKKQAKYWENLWDAETQHIRPKLPNGQFIANFDPMKPWDGFQEGNAAQYTWYVPHDIQGLIDRMGKDTFVSRLDTTFAAARQTLFGGGSDIDSFSGVSMLYNQGNQPCLHNAWLFNYAGEAWKTQFWTRTIGQEFYGTSGIHGYGYGQDEDQGQLGAWYVLASTGLFDVRGLTDMDNSMQLGSPVFDKVTITLHPDYYDGKEFVLETKNNAPEHHYIQSASVNGEDWNKCWISWKDIVEGGKVSLEMGPEPNTSWGTDGVHPVND